jgi:hypothetical protein
MRLTRVCGMLGRGLIVVPASNPECVLASGVPAR